MKVSWELVSPLSPGSYIYPPVTWYGSHIGQVSARPPLIGRQLAWLETVTTEPVAWRDSLARREDWRTGGLEDSLSLSWPCWLLAGDVSWSLLATDGQPGSGAAAH